MYVCTFLFKDLLLKTLNNINVLKKNLCTYVHQYTLPYYPIKYFPMKNKKGNPNVNRDSNFKKNEFPLQYPM